MHIIQYIATQADDKQHAHSSVKHYLEELLGSGDTYTTWFDWFVTGGGRFSTSPDPYDDSYTGDVVHQSEAKFQEYLDTAIKWRDETLTSFVNEAREINLVEILDSLGDPDVNGFIVGNKLYPVKKIYDMALGTWNYDQHYLDIVTDSTNMVHMKKSIDNGADNWYLVPVDFHF